MVMKKKWIKDLGMNECIHAPTQEISDKICKKFDELGLTWSNGYSYLDNTYYSFNKENTHYHPYLGAYSDGCWEDGGSLKVYTINDLLDFEVDCRPITDEGYTKEEIELLDRFAGIVLGVALSEFNLANGVSNGVVDIVCADSYITAKSMLRARKEALKNV